MARPALPPPTPPEPGRADRPAGVLRLPDVRDRADVPAALALARQAAEVARAAQVRCEAGAVTRPGMPIVEVIARLALDARRNHRELRLAHASPELLELLELCGLGDVAELRSPSVRSVRRPAHSR